MFSLAGVQRPQVRRGHKFAVIARRLRPWLHVQLDPRLESLNGQRWAMRDAIQSSITVDAALLRSPPAKPCRQLALSDQCLDGERVYPVRWRLPRSGNRLRSSWRRTLSA